MSIVISHGDFTFATEKVEEQAKNIEVVNRTKSFWGQFCTPDSSETGDKLIIRRQILIDPTALHTLNEGGTPSAEKIKVTSYEITTNCYGSYCKYTRHAYLKNRDDLMEMMGNQLACSRLYDIEAVRSNAYLSGTNAITKGASETWFDFITRAKVILVKNKVRVDSHGGFNMVCSPEHVALILKEIKTDGGLVGTNSGVAVVEKGFVTDYAGVRIFEHFGDEMYNHTAQDGQTPASTTGNIFFFGLSENGAYPVKSRNVSEANAQLISKEIGSSGSADPTNEFGTLASRIDYMAAALEHPECLLKGAVSLTYVAPTVPLAYEIDSSATKTSPTA